MSKQYGLPLKIIFGYGNENKNLWFFRNYRKEPRHKGEKNFVSLYLKRVVPLKTVEHDFIFFCREYEV